MQVANVMWCTESSSMFVLSERLRCLVCMYLGFKMILLYNQSSHNCTCSLSFSPPFCCCTAVLSIFIIKCVLLQDLLLSLWAFLLLLLLLLLLRTIVAVVTTVAVAVLLVVKCNCCCRHVPTATSSSVSSLDASGHRVTEQLEDTCV